MIKALKSTLAVAILFFIQTAVVNAQDVQNPFVGKWDAVILDLPQGEMAGLLKVEVNNGALSGSFTDKIMKKEVVFTSVELKDSVLNVGFSYQGMAVTMVLNKKDTDTIEGVILDSYKIKAVRIKEKDLNVN